MRIMISGKQMPLNVRERLHPLNWCPKRNRVWRFVVIDVTGDEYVLGAVCARQLSEALDRAEARLSQSFFLRAELPEDLSDLPVCGVNKPHQSSPLMPRAGPTPDRLIVASPRADTRPSNGFQQCENACC
jgi:hypothetical protein